MTCLDRLITIVGSTLSEYVLYVANRIMQLVSQQDVSAKTFDSLVVLAVDQHETMGYVGSLDLCTVLFAFIKDNSERTLDGDDDV